MSLWRRGPLSDVLLDHSPPEFLRQSLSLSPELTDLPRLTGWRAPRSLQSLSPQHWDCKSRPPPSTLCSCWRLKLRSSHLHLNGLSPESPASQPCSVIIISSSSHCFLTSMGLECSFLLNQHAPGTQKGKLQAFISCWDTACAPSSFSFSPSLVTFLQFCVLATFSRKANLVSNVSLQRHSVEGSCPHSVFPSSVSLNLEL